MKSDKVDKYLNKKIKVEPFDDLLKKSLDKAEKESKKKMLKDEKEKVNEASGAGTSYEIMWNTFWNKSFQNYGKKERINFLQMAKHTLKNEGILTDDLRNAINSQMEQINK